MSENTPTTSAEPPTASLHLADEFINRQTPVQRIRTVLYRYPAISPAIVLIIAGAVFAIRRRRVEIWFCTR